MENMMVKKPTAMGYSVFGQKPSHLFLSHQLGMMVRWLAGNIVGLSVVKLGRQHCWMTCFKAGVQPPCQKEHIIQPTQTIRLHPDI
jgi:hypothetical protein